jgi:mono/diheme cytochrome c family protein
MFDQAKKEAYEASDFFADGASSRPLPEHTVARGHLREDRGYYLGVAADGTLIAEPPMPVDREMLLRGRKMFEAQCSMCHDRAGTGNGMVVQRGYPRPPSYHQPRLREMPAGYFVNVITAGFGRMPSYAAQVDPADRWAIAAYVKVLQAAQAVPVNDLDPAVRARLETERAAAEAEAAAEAAAEATGHGGGHGAEDAHGVER